MKPHIQKADPAARTKATRIVLAATVIGCLLIGLFQLYRSEVINGLSGALLDNPNLITFSALVLMLPLMAGAVYLWRLAGKTIQSHRYPPAGVAVTRHTPVCIGTAAIRRGRFLQGMAILLSVAALLIPGMLHLLLQTLTH